MSAPSFPRLRTGRAALGVLALSWSAVLPGTAFAGRPIDPAAELPLPESSSLLAQVTQALPEPTAGTVPAGAVDEAAPLTTPPPSKPAPTPSDSLAVNILKRLVQHGVLPKEEADELVSAAEAETQEVRARQTAAQQQLVETAVDRALAGAQAQFTAAATAANAEDAELFAASASAVRVPYLPETVRAQLREEIKRDVMAQARRENWAAPNVVPDWTRRFRLFADVRLRGEADFFGQGNDNTGAFPNFNAINTGAPFDVSGNNNPPFQNVDKDRQRLRLRVRLGAEADLGNGFSAGLRLATGETNSPVSPNQSLGLANQTQGGNFSKYAIWLDRGFLRYTLGQDPERQVALSFGRFDNPFYNTEIVFDDDVGFDGVAVGGRYRIKPGLVPFFAGGLFPVFNTDFNFSSNRPEKYGNSDKWLYGGQIGTEWNITKDLHLKVASAYYHYQNVEGRLSSPFLPLSAADQGNTDDTRPSFAQKGNTYRPLRQIISSPLNNFGTTNQFQYYGLATPFHELAITGQLDYNRWAPFQLSLSGEWVKNVGFDRRRADQFAVNNRGPDSASGALGKFAGGDTAWIIGLRGGHILLQKTWDWQVGVNYRYVESDSVVDGLTDSEFGLGGTNLKGYTIYGALALSPNVSLGLRWMSANEVAGAPFKADILQLDINGKF